MRYLIMVLVSLPLLAGCSTMGMTPQQVAAADASQCEGYGFKLGTDAHAQCLMQVDQSRTDRAFQRRQAFKASLQDDDVTCRSSSFGGSTTTRCY